MNAEIVMLGDRPPKDGKDKLTDFLAELSEDELLAALEEPLIPTRQNENLPLVPHPNPSELENNTRLTIVRMLETTKMETPFTFSVRRYCGPAYVQGMRTTLARARRFAREQGQELADEFRMLVLSIETQPMCDVVTVMRVPKGKKMQATLAGLAALLGGSQIKNDDEDEE